MPFSTSLRPTLGLGRALNSTARTFSNTASRPIARMIITGRLGAEPELSTTSTGQEIVRYAIATSSGSRDNRQTNWFRVGAFMPDNASREYFLSLPKGTMLYVDGDATMRSYEGPDGKQHTALNIAQRTFEVLQRGRPKGEGEGESESQ